MNKVYLLLAKHGPNDAGEVIDVYATDFLANVAKGFLEAEHRDYVNAINTLNPGYDGFQPIYFTATLVVEERT